ncbi:chloramphenicol resistance protein [Usnea florida]
MTPPEPDGDVVDSKAVPPAENSPAEKATEDLEALHQIPSRPVYSVFSDRQRKFIVFMVACAGFFSPLSANIYFPALNALSRDLKVSNELINLTLTSYMIFQGLAPTVFGDFADMTGRRPAYILGFIIYIGANIGLALQNNYAALVLLRCLQSTGSSGTVALGNGVVADIASSGERGKFMGIAQFGPMAAPALAPVIGGILTQFLGWRWLFWFLLILAVCYMIPLLVTFPETGRNVVGNGSIPPQGWNMSLLNYLKTRNIEHDDALNRTRKLRWPNPLKTIHIILEKDVGLLLFYNSLVYTAFYDVTASLPSQFAEIYGFNELQIGFAYRASILFGRLMDMNYKRVAKNAGLRIDIKRGDDMRNFPLEKARIQVFIIPLYFGIAAILVWGWVLERNAPLAAPLVLSFIIGLCLTGSFNVMSTMLVDLYPSSPATATAANNLVRCLMGAAGTAVIIQMINGMGRGWCFTFIAAVIFFTSPLLWVEMKWGPKWREQRRVRMEKREEVKEARRKAKD